MKQIPKLIASFSTLIPYKRCCYLVALLVFVGCNQQKANGENKGAAAPPAAQMVAGSSQHLTAAEKANSIMVVNWNIEWLGSAVNGPKNKEQQLRNAVKILQYLKADLYCLCEIVDPASLIKLTEALGSNYAYALSPYASGARSAKDPGYGNAQKLAFIYNTTRFKNIKTSAYLSRDPRAGFYFASGRYPFNLEATVHTAEVDQPVDFMILHAKSGADQSSYDRRRKAAMALKAAIDKEKNSEAIMLLGDFNDHVKGSITAGKPSPYIAFTEDPAYHVLTESLADGRSTLDYAGVIDQQIISKALNRYYLSGSTGIRADITSVVPDFKRGGTSDHYPVSSVFIFDKKRYDAPPLATVINNSLKTSKDDADEAEDAATASKPQKLQQKIFSASVSTGNILIQAAVKSQHIQFILYNKRQHKVLSVHRKYILKGDHFRLKTPDLYKGDYTLVIFSDHGKQVIPFTVK
ncbi:endonuclease/exonuclease/phosphatase family protein [Arachidicoccus terrestris]|uniref:endonuclease/exonuclease/phosphatase family protein n=1 Tax=Arachidicoccus terrestris TaxID=2875539 RepID=UPI001CC390DD|nr:endonuclease/exonuclease/phosphatase family protein [Arachidicoccus terrestris]UAY56851.1 hypothetical protein K9M52_07620 [Arachidicoccus terrestris]